MEWTFTPYIHGGIGPKYLESHAIEEDEIDNFTEGSLEFTFDWLRYRKIWLDINIEPGLRFYKQDYTADFSYYSDFVFVETCLFAYWWIMPQLRLDCIFTYSPEWHNISADDITTLYFSTNLKYEFFED